MSTIGPVDHIAREPLPWRTRPHLTECGKPVEPLGDRVVSRGTIETRIRDIGQKRAAFTTCMTCVDTSDRWSGRRQRSDLTALRAVVREGSAVEHATPPRHTPPGDRDAMCVCGDNIHHHRDSTRERDLWERRERLRAELQAVAALVDAHREEFDAYLSGLSETVNLTERRNTKRRRGAL